MECLPLRGIQFEALPIRKGFLGAVERALQDELTNRSARRGGGPLQDPLCRRGEAKIELLITSFHASHTSMLACQTVS